MVLQQHEQIRVDWLPAHIYINLSVTLSVDVMINEYGNVRQTGARFTCRPINVHHVDFIAYLYLLLLYPCKFYENVHEVGVLLCVYNNNERYTSCTFCFVANYESTVLPSGMFLIISGPNDSRPFES
jgi:hypothetical protein